MPFRLPVALIAGLALAGGLGACGSGDATGDVVPRTTPELRPPEATTLGDAPAADPAATTTTESGTTTTDTTQTEATPPAAEGGTDDAGGAAPAPAPAAPEPAAPAAPAAPAETPAAPADGAGTGGAGGGTGGGAATPDANPGGANFDEFCEQNPGACGQ